MAFSAFTRPLMSRTFQLRGFQGLLRSVEVNRASVANGRSFHLFARVDAAADPKKKAAQSVLGKLRKKTGYSLSLCKKALAECDQDVDKAKKWLNDQAQAQGWNKANKLEGRNTTQGLIGVCLSKDAKIAAMIELNSETDFVARNKQFHILLNAIVDLCLTQAPGLMAPSDDQVQIKQLNKEQLMALPAEEGKTIGDLVAMNIGQIGENLIINRAILYQINPKASDNVKLATVTHPSAKLDSVKVGYGRFGTIISYIQENPNAILPEGQTLETLVRQLCLHVIGMNPQSLGNMDEEKTVEVKQEENTEKIVEPKGEGEQADEDWTHLEEKSGFDSSTELVHQIFLTNASMTVREVLLESGLRITNFDRYEVGKGPE